MNTKKKVFAVMNVTSCHAVHFNVLPYAYFIYVYLFGDGSVSYQGYLRSETATLVLWKKSKKNTKSTSAVHFTLLMSEHFRHTYLHFS